MPTLDVTLSRDGRAEPIRFEVRRIVNAGFTGRDREAVRRHLDELRQHGVPCPTETPVLYPKPASLVTTADELEVFGFDTSGEGEFVLLCGPDRVLVAAGSDHTDRELEKTTIEKSKVVCSSVVSREVWDLADARSGWDDLALRSHVTAGGRRSLYQEGRLAELMTPRDLIALVRERLGGDVTGTLIFSGTLPLLGGQFVCGERFEVEIVDERRQRALRCDYRVRALS
jgi:hypothetical protein